MLITPLLYTTKHPASPSRQKLWWNIFWRFDLRLRCGSSAAGRLCHQRATKKKCPKVLEGPRRPWTATNCETKLWKMSSITSLFTFPPSSFFWKGPYWKFRGRWKSGSPPPGRREKCPFCHRRSRVPLKVPAGFGSVLVKNKISHQSEEGLFFFFCDWVL